MYFFNGLLFYFFLITGKDALTSFSLQANHKVFWRVDGFPSSREGCLLEVLNVKNPHSLSDFIITARI